MVFVLLCSVTYVQPQVNKNRYMQSSFDNSMIIIEYKPTSMKIPVKGPVCETLQHLVAKNRVANNGNVNTLLRCSSTSCEKHKTAGSGAGPL